MTGATLADLEKVLPSKRGVKYPVCMAGARRCPPDDCGGPCGFVDLLRALKDPDDEENEALMEWVGEAYDLSIHASGKM